jgi:adenylate kinase
MNKGVLFVAGIHGVGKGYLVNELLGIFSCQSFSASSLIKEEKKAEVDLGKVVVDPRENQDYLLIALNKLEGGRDIFLDGHFCLFSENEIYEVPLATFEGMNLKAIVLVIEEPEVIFSRLNQRDGNSKSILELNALQEAEINRAEFIAGELGAPMITVKSGDTLEVAEFLAQRCALHL